jgi:hypothetical protein
MTATAAAGESVTNKQFYMPWVVVIGLITGLVSVIPIVNLLNCLFCGWMLLGAGLTVKLVSDKAGVTIEPGEGALIGLFTGIVTGLFVGVVQAGISLAFQTSAFSAFGGNNPFSNSTPGMGALIQFCVNSVLYPIFATLGGLLGAVIFKKDPPPGGGYGGAPPPGGGFGSGPFGGPPQGGGGYGGPPQGGGGFGGPPQGGGGFGGPPQGGGGFGGPPQGGGGGGGFGGPPQGGGGGGFGGPPQGGGGGGFGGPPGGGGGFGGS